MWKINPSEALELAGWKGVGNVVKYAALIFSLFSMRLHVKLLPGDVDALDPHPWGFI